MLSPLIGLQVVRVQLLFPQQVDQRLEYVIQTDDPVGHRGAADPTAMALEDAFEALLPWNTDLKGMQ